MAISKCKRDGFRYHRMRVQLTRFLDGNITCWGINMEDARKTKAYLKSSPKQLDWQE